MKNKQISPGQIPHLVRVTADLFRKMREETKAPNMNPLLQRDEHEHMHYIADLLKDLVNTAYPLENEPAIEQPATKNKPIGQRYHEYRQDLNQRGLAPFVMSFERFKELEEDLENIAKMVNEKSYTTITKLDLDPKAFEEGLKKISEMMKNYKPPKPGDYTW